MIFSGLGYLRPGNPRFMVRTFAELNPLSTLFKRIIVLISKPAETRSTKVMAISLITRAPRKRFRVADAPELGPPSLSDSSEFVRDLWNAAARPKIDPCIITAA